MDCHQESIIPETEKLELTEKLESVASATEFEAATMAEPVAPAEMEVPRQAEPLVARLESDDQRVWALEPAFESDRVASDEDSPSYMRSQSSL